MNTTTQPKPNAQERAAALCAPVTDLSDLYRRLVPYEGTAGVIVNTYYASGRVVARATFPHNVIPTQEHCQAAARLVQDAPALLALVTRMAARQDSLERELRDADGQALEDFLERNTQLQAAYEKHGPDVFEAFLGWLDAGAPAKGEAQKGGAA